MYSMKCTAWLAISKFEIIRAFCFENADEEGIIVTEERYNDTLNKIWRALGTHRGVYRNVQWFYKDGATPHTANITIEWLNYPFLNRLISRRREPEWSPHSSDLNPPGFYLWGFLKDNVYENNPLLNSK